MWAESAEWRSDNASAIHLQGCDCLGTIKYWDGVLTNTKGEPMVIKKAICMHEEDYGAPLRALADDPVTDQTVSWQAPRRFV
jgi:Cu2+-containing amine oxidase